MTAETRAETYATDAGPGKRHRKRNGRARHDAILLDPTTSCYHIGDIPIEECKGVHVITRKRLVDFWEDHPEAEAPLRIWLKIIERRSYTGPGELKTDFVSASFLGAGCTVFNIGGNKFRLVVTMRYDMGKVFVVHVLTHRQYDEHTANGTLCP